MNDPDSPRVLYAEFTALPGTRDEVAALVSELGHLVRQEPGNLAFAVSTRTRHPDAFFVYEEYRDAAAFDAHIAADYSLRFNESLGPLIVEEASALSWLTPL